MRGCRCLLRSGECKLLGQADSPPPLFDDRRSIDVLSVETGLILIENVNPQISPSCAVSPWSEWSSCSVPCGTGFRVRTRGFLNRRLAVMAHCGVEQLQRAVCRSKVSELDCVNPIDRSGSMTWTEYRCDYTRRTFPETNDPDHQPS